MTRREAALVAMVALMIRSNPTVSKPWRTPAPELPVQLPADLDLVRAGPVRQLVQADAADPAAGLLLDRRSGSEAVAFPLLQDPSGQHGHVLGAEWGTDHDVAGDHRISQQPGELGQVVGLPGPQ
jgi:hypothetical protein